MGNRTTLGVGGCGRIDDLIMEMKQLSVTKFGQELFK